MDQAKLAPLFCIVWYRWHDSPLKKLDDKQINLMAEMGMVERPDQF